ncbi:MAG: hypothetical protein KME04_06595 [Pleurocapsa minor GSE-CHR-MK-17-07R]|jgi:xylulokinase|nr:hypothetical protein [Pleurocapsa minor GSE-CHR-MK 17-07R]
MLWLAFDVGTTGLKAGLVRQLEDGTLTLEAHEMRPYATHTGAAGVVEQDARDWWRAAVEACLTLYRNSGEQPDAIALTGQMQDTILLDSAGEPVRPVILYSDSRAVNESETLSAALDMAALGESVGSEQGPGGLLPKLMWLTANEPESAARTAHLLLGAADVLALRMTGAACSDSTTASTTGLMHLAAGDWQPESVFAAAGLSDWRAKLPKLVRGGSQVGTLGEDAAEALGIQAGIPVYLGAGDAGSTTIGAGCGEPGHAYLYVGTSGWAAMSVPVEARPPLASGVFALAHPDASRLFVIAPLLTAGGNLAWIRGVTGSTGVPYEDVIAAAVEREPTRLLYLPYLTGERSPFTDPAAAGAFIGVRAQHTPADLTRAVLEGVAMAYRHILSSVLATLPANGLLMTGGGARSAAWGQIFADVLGIPVRRAAALEHTGLLGAVATAQAQQGDNGAYARLAAVEDAAYIETPREAWRAHYDAQFALYAQAYPALKAIFAAQA